MFVALAVSSHIKLEKRMYRLIVYSGKVKIILFGKWQVAKLS